MSSKPSPPPKKFTRRRLLWSLASLTGIGYYTNQIEPHWLEITHHDLPIQQLHNSLKNKILLQISDIHVGKQVKDSYLLRAFSRLRALKPDIVVYTGDFITYHPNILTQLAPLLPHFPLGTLATIGIPGNHDYNHWWTRRAFSDQLFTQLKTAGINILRNQTTTIQNLQIVGLDDRWGPRYNPQKALSQTNPNSATLVLSHNPDNVDDPTVWTQFQGPILSGHTHGGQCKSPFLPPPFLPVKNRTYVAGWYQLPGNRSMYINRGLGHLVQARFDVRPEATLFTLSTA